MNEIFSKNSCLNGMGLSTKTNSSKRNKKLNDGGMINVKGIILCGNGPLKSELNRSKFLKHFIKKAIISVVDVNYGGKSGFYECIKKCDKLLAQTENESDDKLIGDINKLLYNSSDMVCIGFDETFRGLKLNAIDYIVLASGYYKYAVQLKEEKEDEIIDVKFAKDKIESNEIKRSMLASSSSNNSSSIKVSKFNKFWYKLCDEKNIKLKMVNIHSPKTQQFAKGLQGCVAVLHYPINLNYDNDEY